MNLNNFRVRTKQPAPPGARAQLAQRIIQQLGPDAPGVWYFHRDGRYLGQFNGTKGQAEAERKKWALNLGLDVKQIIMSRDTVGQGSELQQASANMSRGDWEFYYVRTDQVLDQVSDISMPQASAVLADVQRRYSTVRSDAIHMRRVPTEASSARAQTYSAAADYATNDSIRGHLGEPRPAFTSQTPREPQPNPTPSYQWPSSEPESQPNVTFTDTPGPHLTVQGVPNWELYDLRTGNVIRTFFQPNLAQALDYSLGYLASHSPGVPLGNFSVRRTPAINESLELTESAKWPDIESAKRAFVANPRLQHLPASKRAAMGAAAYLKQQSRSNDLVSKLKTPPVQNWQDVDENTQQARRARAFIDQVYSQYPEWPYGQADRVMVWGSGEDQQFAAFKLIPGTGDNTVEIDWIMAGPEQRKGVGSRAIQELQRQAQAAGIRLTLYPWANGRISQASLSRLYRRHGFKPITKGAKPMAWEPVAEGVFDRFRKNKKQLTPLPADGSVIKVLGKDVKIEYNPDEPNEIWFIWKDKNGKEQGEAFIQG
jgi:GNAT superfamily N-acetyltransferase